MKRRADFVMIHFKALELYPPVINLLDYLGKNADEKILVISTDLPEDSHLKRYQANASNIWVKRTGSIKPGSLFRIFQYLRFYISSLLLLIKLKPAVVLYFESISSWPALMYKKILGDSVKLMVHYHEYTTVEEYAHSMRLVKRMHQLEKTMYKNSFNWISHTNEIRLQRFKVDYSLNQIPADIFYTMPNYPSKFWAAGKSKTGKSEKNRLVYIGALGYDNMYLKETIDWVLSNNQFLSLDLYANIIDTKAADFIKSIKDESINYHGGCNYADLPDVLKMYDVGLVMYKPFDENTVNAVSNKVFEYLACGLDVWFSEDMTYTSVYTRRDVYPKVLPINFNRLDDFDFKRSFKRNGLSYQPTDYFCENVYAIIYDKMSRK